MTIRVEEGKISRVSVSKGEDESDSPEDNDFYLGWAVNGRTRSGQFYPGLPAQIVSSQGADVDTISGATYSSGTIRSIAAQIISEIPVIEGEEAGNREEEAQTENNAEGQAAAPAKEDADVAAKENADAAAKEDADAAAKEDADAAAEEEETRDEEEQMPEADGTGKGAGNEGGDGA